MMVGDSPPWPIGWRSLAIGGYWGPGEGGGFVVLLFHTPPQANLPAGSRRQRRTFYKLRETRLIHFIGWPPLAPRLVCDWEED